MTEGSEPVWRDPLVDPSQPSGSGSGAYVEQPDPRANPMTIEGEIAGMGDVASGAARRGGPTGVVARIIIGCVLLAFVAAAVMSAVSSLR